MSATPQVETVRLRSGGLLKLVIEVDWKTITAGDRQYLDEVREALHAYPMAPKPVGSVRQYLKEGGAKA